MATWTKQKLGDFVDINLYSINKDFLYTDIEYIDISSVGTGKLDGINTLKLTDAPSRAKRLIRDGDTILSTVRPNRRSFLYIKKPPQNRVVSTGFAVLTPTKIDSRFLYYIISQQEFTDYLAKNAKGAAYPAIDEAIIRRAEIKLPERKFQERISSVLAAYDDLIENNEKRIKILEEMTQRLYIEWFIKFKFPGHEKVRMVDSGTEYGMIPEGWEVTKLGNKIKIKKGKNITKETIIHGVVPVIAGGLNAAYYHNKANTKWPIITISASGANAGFVNLHYENVWASDCSYIDLSVTRNVYFYYLYLKKKNKEIKNLQRGAAQPHVYPKDLMTLSIIDYPETLIDNFQREVDKLFALIGIIKNKNRFLTKTRDLLIPQLITGKREVK